MPIFIPGDDSEIQVDTSYDSSTRVNYVDATVWADALTVNSGAAKAVAIPASGWIAATPAEEPSSSSSASSESSSSESSGD